MSSSYADREAIRDVSARYNIAADSRDLDSFADCFVAGGVFDLVGLARLEGYDALKSMIGALDFPTLHVSTDAVINTDGDSATQRSAVMIFAREPDSNTMVVLTTGRYTDRLVRTGAGWRFSERIVETDNALGAAISQLSPAFAAAIGTVAG
ncbi:nuclear transport factor 2 family protein [Mycobacterium sp.]|uniref:nuclear transport factor 2 family protein n=1 Tax=Mycobacterium sp. TaxID=1785 RepID=UPI00122A2662|nr:nuclear transport factor 2 family protein [Mycobacterium sp.]TAM70244.1 MAG: nuclear transport factor 2 family protein [Mycobacterium sp.]